MTPIGIIHTPFERPENMPIQSKGGMEYEGIIEIYPQYTPGLKDLDGFSHLYLLYLFDRQEGYDLQVKPFLDEVKRGVFATRAPRRPNPLGLSIVKLEGIEGNQLRVSGIDVLNQTPLLDIKPYTSKFDVFTDVKDGWLENTPDVKHHRSDHRFSQ